MGEGKGDRGVEFLCVCVAQKDQVDWREEQDTGTMDRTLVDLLQLGFLLRLQLHGGVGQQFFHVPAGQDAHHGGAWGIDRLATFCPPSSRVPSCFLRPLIQALQSTMMPGGPGDRSISNCYIFRTSPLATSPPPLPSPADVPSDSLPLPESLAPVATSQLSSIRAWL